jgi:lipoprotein-releasing system permease protein
MKYEYFIARRYLKSKHKINFISIISVLSIAGITIGVAALIVVLSVFNGFGSLVTSFLVSFDPQIRIEFISPEASAQQQKVKQIINQIPEIKDFAPFVTGKALAYRSGELQVITVKGIEKKTGTSIYDMKSSMGLGKYNIFDRAGLPGLLLGLPLADHIESIVGDTVTIISPAGIENAIAQFSLPTTQKFIISGIYNSRNNEYDDSYMFVSLPVAQKILGYGKRIQGYELKLDNMKNADRVKKILDSKLNPSLFTVNTWYDFHKELYSVMVVERWTAYFILLLIIAVASFNVLGSLSMSVIEKQRDIGILRSMGVGEKSILKIFMYEGILIGIIGTVFGSLLGYFICFLQLQYKIYPLDPTQYKVDALPLQLRITDFFFIAGASLLLSFLTSLYPAKRAARVDPLEAIKWE